MKLTLRVWRQKGPSGKGAMVEYRLDDVSPDMSFLEMLDVLNERLILAGDDPIAFDHDCREGICGMCSLVINGTPHGPERATTTCQLHMREFSDGEVIDIEPGGYDTGIWDRAEDELRDRRPRTGSEASARLYDKVLQRMGRAGSRMGDPADVAVAIRRVLTEGHPPAHVRIGPGAGTLRLVDGLLPVRVHQGAVRGADAEHDLSGHGAPRSRRRRS